MNDLSGARWFKSSKSQGGEACVEVAHFAGRTGVRDSKHRGGPELMFSVEDWATFNLAVAAGKFDRT
ncbi:DUF397 domain-containing protein [Nocardia sp. NBC_00511]|uniref:DUF397 domain-containing protein n=1 Tax=Nocardia sp. NBC_00511 TaxID=2903591 RepID=UPI0030E087E0